MEQTKAVLELMQTLRERGKTVILIGHNIDDPRAVA